MEYIRMWQEILLGNKEDSKVDPYAMMIAGGIILLFAIMG